MIFVMSSRKYPKDICFVGWHPNCRCFVIPILKSRKSCFDKNQKLKRSQGNSPQNFKEMD